MHQSRHEPNRQLSTDTTRRPFIMAIVIATSGVLFGLASGGIDALEIPGEETKIVPDDPVPASGFYSDFGAAVDLEDRMLVVGAPDDDVAPGLNRAGAAYVFERVGSQWIQRAKLTAPVPEHEARFGTDVGITIGPGPVDDFIIVGAPLADVPPYLDSGKAYIFRRDGSTWVFDQELTPDEKRNFNYFGNAVDIDVSVPVNSTSGDWIHTAVVGSYKSEVSPWSDQGSIHIYQYYGGPPSFQGELAFSGNTGVQLGTSVAIDHGLIVAGAPVHTYSGVPGGLFAGVGHLFSRGNDLHPGFFWGWAGQLEVSDPQTSHLMGETADLLWNPPLAALGAPDTDLRGAVFIYEVLNPGLDRTEIQRIPNPESFGSFGAAVAMDGDLLAIGDPDWNDPAAQILGVVYLYQFNGTEYVLLGRLNASDTMLNLYGYGLSTTIDDGLLATGAPGLTIPGHEDWVYINEIDAELFSDGFESGDTSVWSATSP